MPFKKYKAFVAKCAKEHGKGWKIEIDDIAKYEGEFFMEYKYRVSRKTEDGLVMVPVLPPFFASHYDEDTNLLDRRVQLAKEEIFSWLDEHEAAYQEYIDFKKLTK